MERDRVPVEGILDSHLPGWVKRLPLDPLPLPLDPRPLEEPPRNEPRKEDPAESEGPGERKTEDFFFLEYPEDDVPLAGCLDLEEVPNLIDLSVLSWTSLTNESSNILSDNKVELLNRLIELVDTLLLVLLRTASLLNKSTLVSAWVWTTKDLPRSLLASLNKTLEVSTRSAKCCD